MRFFGLVSSVIIHCTQLCRAYYHEASVRPNSSFTYLLKLSGSNSYGHTVVDKNDQYVRLVSEASRSTSEAAVPGAFLVDLFPSRKTTS